MVNLPLMGASTGGQRNTSADPRDVLKPKVCRGRALNWWAMASRPARIRCGSRAAGASTGAPGHWWSSCCRLAMGGVDRLAFVPYVRSRWLGSQPAARCTGRDGSPREVKACPPSPGLSPLTRAAMRTVCLVRCIASEPGTVSLLPTCSSSGCVRSMPTPCTSDRAKGALRPRHGICPYRPFAVWVGGARASLTPVATIDHMLLRGGPVGIAQIEVRQQPLIRWLESQFHDSDRGRAPLPKGTGP